MNPSAKTQSLKLAALIAGIKNRSLNSNCLLVFLSACTFPCPSQTELGTDRICRYSSPALPSFRFTEGTH